MVNQFRWKQPEYSKNKINRAGDTIRDQNIDETSYAEAIRIVDNWRASHAYPLHVFYIHLRRMAETKPGAIVAERLKRLDSIIGKLSREEGMQLTRMQDLGGCRVILDCIEDVYSFRDKFVGSKIRHEFVREYDYIACPKKSGYRSLHLVYKFHSDTPGKEIFNNNMLIELQLRTHLQHVWATALETMGIFSNQALKAGEGDETVKRFFIVTSSLFALEEGCEIAPETPSNRVELIGELKAICRKHNILERLKAISAAIMHEKRIIDRDGYYILILNYEKHQVTIKYFMASQNEEAREVYKSIESQKNNSFIDAVLVRAGSLATVKEAYPNYFLDIREFINRIEKYTS